MSTAAETPGPIAAAPPAPITASDTPIARPELYRLSVEQYERAAELGILDDPRVELIDGLLVKK
jgi:hypothetical protein